jgi:hypothetical protein
LRRDVCPTRGAFGISQLLSTVVAKRMLASQANVLTFVMLIETDGASQTLLLGMKTAESIRSRGSGATLSRSTKNDRTSLHPSFLRP